MRRRGVVDGPAGTAIAALREGQCTLAITAAEIPDPRLELEALSFVRRAAIAAATHPLAARSRSGEPLTGAELADHVQIVVPDPSHLTGGARFRRVVSRNDNATKHALILAGVGWGSLPLWLVECDLAEGRLVRIAAAEFGQQGETFVRALSGLQDGSLPVLPRERSAKHCYGSPMRPPQGRSA